MSQEILERAFNMTKELEQKQMRKMELAKEIGRTIGSTVAIVIDTVIVWVIVNYLIGVSVGFVPVLGGTLLFICILAKIRHSK